ncbi:pyruvate kinase [Desulfocapsa sulfexigens DSM 10523]|uniref:Pyruvate kinase n=1 Tax=Desulfocapsa sulfexigens (strain DSM 10523 / SB164P1) TaxID=1167006 RepID=M1NAM4_DESSD|nr:pyruvate kinase [Desulfocapsa sulfexigens]AGF76889.1 pyruvate kinase [Desulfocapsa sulfexigens DSM 10523]
MRILILEDSKASRVLLEARLNKAGHTTQSAVNGRQGFFLATSRQYDAIISDLNMPGWDGFKFIEAMKVVCPRIPIIVITGSANEPDTKERLLSFEMVIGVFGKPFDFDKINVLLSQLKGQSNSSVSKMARIVATIGPASNSKEILGKMIVAGMDVARLNFSHGTHEEHGQTLANIRAAETEWGKPIAVLQDLCGPKIRTGQMEKNGVQLTVGKTVIIQADETVGTASRFSTIAPEILIDLREGDPILLDDGLLELKVTKEGAREVLCKIIVGGILKSSKGINLPMTQLSLPSVTEKDKRDLAWGLDHSIDYVALSFVRSAAEIRDIKKIIAASGKRDIRVIAKIEKPEAVEHITDIIEAADAIMIARGDMGIELPAARVPRIQQEIINLCWQQNTPVITATQMLDSMTANTIPTRAEVTDVSVAIKEGTDAVMLSGETAAGKDPVNVVRTMASIITEEEQYQFKDPFENIKDDTTRANPAITAAANLPGVVLTMLLDARGVLYQQLSKYSRNEPNILVTRSLHVARHSSLYKNLVPIIIRDDIPRDEVVFKAMGIAKEWGYLKTGDIFAVVEGERLTQGGIPQTGAFQLITVS